MKYVDMIKGIIIAAAVAWLFYDSIFAMILVVPAVQLFCRKGQKERERKRIRHIKIQFADAVASCAGAMEAGYSIENAFIEAYKDMQTMYGEEAVIVHDLKMIINKLKINCNVEDTIMEYAKYRRIYEIEYFGDVLSIAKKAGGNIPQIMKGTRDVIYEKEDMERQIEIAIASKRYESMIMELMPLGMLAYFRIFSPGFITGMYGNLNGIITMSVMLGIYVILVVVAEKMCTVKV